MGFDDAFFEQMADPMTRAFKAMDQLEAGAIANPDEQRMVGHYWLRAPELAPDEQIAADIRQTVDRIRQFAADVHAGHITAGSGQPFTDLLVVGIGGSALGPQLAADCLGSPGHDRLAVHFIDNTDSDGMQRVFATIGERLPATLVIVISKSGGTPETRNGMIATAQQFDQAGLDLAPNAVAVTSEGSKLDTQARRENWLARFPMWDFVGGRTSQTSAVGLLPAALQGLDIDQLLDGAAACDRITKNHDIDRNPAALLALMWYHATDGRGSRDMVILPYKDRLLLLSRYLQQLVMESLGKATDLDGQPVEQGITVYGNKGSTDQHAYVQQLREGVRNFFVTFIEVLNESDEGAIEVEPNVTAGDYLRGFFLGTQAALSEAGRPSMTLTVDRVDAHRLGVLIGLFERAVGLYASLININAYHQPGVEAGKKAAAAVLKMQQALIEQLGRQAEPRTVEQLAEAVDGGDVASPIETAFKLLEGLAANGRVHRVPGQSPFDAKYAAK
jgi:glucose-6-phosphate isomerase